MKNQTETLTENAVINPSLLSPRLQEAFERFVEYHPAKRLSKNLRSILLEFLMYDGSGEAEYLQELVIDLEGLFELLEVAQEEWKGTRVE